MGTVISKTQLNGKERTVESSQELIFWMHDCRVAIPNDVWTPFPFSNIVTNLCDDRVGTRWGLYARPTDVVGIGSGQFAATTVAVGSNGAVLPTATINVVTTLKPDGTPAFADAGYIVIKASTLQGGGATDTVVKYAGRTSTSFTGCTLGTGTLATNDAVRQANITFEKQGAGGPASFEVAWEHNATGVRGVRFRNIDGFFNLESGTDVRSAAAAASPNAPLRCQTNDQPINTSGNPPTSGTGVQCEVYQNSGVVLNTFAPLGLSAPRLVVMNVCPAEISSIF